VLAPSRSICPGRVSRHHPRRHHPRHRLLPLRVLDLPLVLDLSELDHQYHLAVESRTAVIARNHRRPERAACGHYHFLELAQAVHLVLIAELQMVFLLVLTLVLVLTDRPESTELSVQILVLVLTVEWNRV
jgi:hypothetical protein